MSIYELLFFVFIACAWPISIRRMLKNRSTKGKSPIFTGVIVAGYIFGIVHKILYDLDIVIAAYFLNLLLVTADTVVYVHVKNKYERHA